MPECAVAQQDAADERKALKALEGTTGGNSH